jgi:hypothetical protein
MALTVSQLLQTAAGRESNSDQPNINSAPSSTGSALWDMLGSLCFVRIPLESVRDDYQQLMRHLALRAQYVRDRLCNFD